MLSLALLCLTPGATQVSPPPSKTHVEAVWSWQRLIQPCLAGAKKLIAKIKEFNPKIAVFNGKGIYEVFSGEKEFIFGKQPEKITGTDTVSWLVG